MASQRAHHDSWSEDEKQRVLTRWPALAASEVEATGGDHEQLLALLQGRLGYAEEHARRDLDEVLHVGMISPPDAADQHTHAGSSAPVPDTHAPSGLTTFPERFPERASEGRAARETTVTSDLPAVGPGPAEPTPGGSHEERAEEPSRPAGRAGGRHDQRWRHQQYRSGRTRQRRPVMTAMTPIAGAAIMLALTSFGMIVFARRRRASRRNRFASMVAASAAGGFLARAVTRYVMAPKDVVRAVGRMR